MQGPNKKTELAFGFGLQRRAYSRITSGTGTGEFDWPVDLLAIHSKSQTDLVGKGDSYLCRSRSLSHRHSLTEGTRPQPMWTDQNYRCGQIKTTWQRLTKFPSATGTLNLLQARTVNRNWNSPDDFRLAIPLLKPLFAVPQLA